MKLEKSNWGLACVRLLLSWHLASSLVSVILLHIPHSYSIQYSIFPIRFNESINQSTSINSCRLGGTSWWAHSWIHFRIPLLRPNN